MKKSNIIILALFITVIGVLGSVFLFKKSPEDSSALGVTAYAEDEAIPTLEYAEIQQSDNGKTAFVVSEGAVEKEAVEYKTISMDDALFIGDSRTMGLLEYAEIEGAAFFCDEGMSVYNIYDKKIQVPGIGKISLDELLSNNSFGKIYIMLGINEVGYKINQTIERYENLVDFVLGKQADAELILMKNLHVTKHKSESGSYVNNKNLNRINEGIFEISQKRALNCIDSNELFDDTGHNLKSSLSGDGAHLYAKYYKEWGEWIIDKTAGIWEEKGSDIKGEVLS